MTLYDPTSIIAICVILPIIALVALCLRFWVRIRVQPTHIGADDWLILVASIFLIADAANLIVGALFYDSHIVQEHKVADLDVE